MSRTPFFFSKSWIALSAIYSAPLEFGADSRSHNGAQCHHPGMPQILIRRLDQHVVRRLRAKAAAVGVSAEEEARRILRRSLVGEVPAMSLIDFIRTMPDVGDGRIFRRPKRKPRKVKL